MSAMSIEQFTNETIERLKREIDKKYLEFYQAGVRDALKDKWIITAERHPDNEETVLCSSVSDEGVCRVLDNWNLEKNDWDNFPGENVAWMPVPEIWEGVYYERLH